MKRSGKTAFITVMISILTALALVGCVEIYVPSPKPAYHFSTEGLTEQKLNAGQHTSLLSNAIGGFIEDEIESGKGAFVFEASKNFDVSGKPYHLSLFIDYDGADAEAQPVLSVAINNGENDLKIGFLDGMFYAEKPDGAGGTARLENDGSIFQSLFEVSGSGGTDSIVKSLNLLFVYVSFVEDSTHYGVKMDKGVEISELTLSTNLFSTVSALVRAMRFLSVERINKDYAGDANKPIREAKIVELDAVLNGTTQFLFGKNYDKIFELPTVFLNLNVVMRNKVASGIELSVSPNPIFKKSTVAA